MRASMGRVSLVIALAAAACGGSHGDDDNGGDDGDGGGPVDAGTDPDAMTPPQCTFTPTGTFDPGVECLWNGPVATSAYPLHDDVVMTPAVMNLTDDDADGDVDLDDVPDIAFVSYRLQEDG